MAKEMRIEGRELLRKSSVYLILILLLLTFSILSPRFLTASNLINVLLQTSIVAMLAIGQTVVMLTAGIDLSVGMVGILCGAIAAGLATGYGFGLNLGTVPAFLLTLILGSVIGGVSGLLIVFGNLPPFVATLAMMAVARGLTLVFTQGKPIAGLPEDFVFVGSGSVLGIPFPVILLFVAVVLAYLLLARTAFGLHIYAIGGNKEMARLAGVNVRRVELGAYIISGLTAAFAGLILTGRLASAQPNVGAELNLESIAACVLGGTSLFGGTGNVLKTIVGALIMGTLANGMNLLGIPSYPQLVIKGLVFIAAVTLDILSTRKRA
ncbi:MAG: ABC transporter permease [Caldiserica bacterium]|jgi:ribose transport system permease protein|nr:ABC transporter permease [Caldisericota bacterium]